MTWIYKGNRVYEWNGHGRRRIENIPLGSETGRLMRRSAFMIGRVDCGRSFIEDTAMAIFEKYDYGKKGEAMLEIFRGLANSNQHLDKISEAAESEGFKWWEIDP